MNIKYCGERLNKMMHRVVIEMVEGGEVEEVGAEELEEGEGEAKVLMRKNKKCRLISS